MQAIKYAAMTSRFTEDTLVEHYVRFRSRSGEVVTEEQAREELIAHAGELDPECSAHRASCWSPGRSLLR